jgi:hypothetical protein
MSKTYIFIAAAALAFSLPAQAADTASLANPTLPVQTIVIDSDHGPVKFRVEMAVDHDTQERGLMFRKIMAPNAGMLFDFRQLVMTSFWMKNTILPLDMLFIRPDGTIASIAANATPYSETPIPSPEPVRAVLEINGGRATQLGIEPGEKVHAAIFNNAVKGQ